MRYYQVFWHHQLPTEPDEILYEVNESGAVLRLLETYHHRATKRRDSIHFHREDELPGQHSLVEGSFFNHLGDLVRGGECVSASGKAESIKCSEITEQQFLAAWNSEI